MRSQFAVPLFAALLLAGCGSADEPKTPQQAQSEAAKIEKPRPGLYRSTSKLVSFDIPGMPPAQAEKLKQMFSSTAQAQEYCLTPQEAEGGMEAAAKKMAEGDCKYERFAATGNSLDAKMTCQTGQGMIATIEMKGTMDSEASQMNMTINQSMPGQQGGAVRMVAEVSSQRIGECPGAAQ